MTRESDQIEFVEKLVIVFDICSSSRILQALTLIDGLEHARNLLISVKDFLRTEEQREPFELYKFVGDGWILLYEPNVRGDEVVPFLVKLSRFFQQEQRRILARLPQEPSILGLTFGADKGRLVRFEMQESFEYVGRALNVACRLQGAIKDGDENPAYKILFSKNAFTDLGINNESYRIREVKRVLRNIDEGEVSCMKLDLQP